MVTQKEKKHVFGQKVPDEFTEFIQRFTFTDATKLNTFVTFFAEGLHAKTTVALKIK